MADTHVSARATALVALVALVVYLPSLSNGFALDDIRDIRDNPAVVNADGAWDVLASPYRGAVPPARSPYRPVTSLTYWLNWTSTGSAPVPFHLVNVVLHVLASILVVRLLGALGADAAGGVLGGLVFAVHPVHVEAVANVVGRADVLMTLFCLAGTLVFLDRSLPRSARALAVSLAYGLALGSKENGVALPALLASTLVLPAPVGVGRTGGAEAPPGANRPSPRDELLVLAPTLLVLLVYLGVRYHVLGTLVHRDTAPYIAILSPAERIATAIANLTELGRLLVVPLDLSADYGPDVITTAGIGSPRFWLGVLTAGLTVGLLWVLYRRQRVGAVAVAWTALSVAVVSNLVIPIGVWVAERTLYLPSVGVAIGVSALTAAAARYAPDRMRMAWGLGLLLVIAGGWRTVDRIPAWNDSETVLGTLAAEHPESYRSQWWLARRLTDVGDLDGGLRWYGQAVRTNPNDLGLALDRVRALLLAGRPSEAEEIASALPPTDPARFVYLAQSKIMTGRPDEARVDVREGLERFPTDPRLLGQADELSGDAGSPAR